MITVGAQLAGTYGLALGWLRVFTGGLGLPGLTHITADATIFNGTIELLSESAGLLEDVQLLLLGFGVKSAVYSLDGFDGGSPERQSPGQRMMRADAVTRRHGLRIDSGSLRAFGRHIGMLPGKKLEQLTNTMTAAKIEKK